MTNEEVLRETGTTKKLIFSTRKRTCHEERILGQFNTHSIIENNRKSE